MRSGMLVLFLVSGAAAAPVPAKPAKVTARVEVRLLTASAGFFARPEVEALVGDGGAALTERQVKELLELCQGDTDTNVMQSPLRSMSDAAPLACEWTGVGVELAADGKTFAITRKAGKARVKVEGDLSVGASLAVRVKAEEVGKGRMAVAVVTVKEVRRP